MIILAHVGPPTILFQIRNFDVPLMVLVSGMSFSLAFKRESYSQYVWKRMNRLLFPVWIFLSIYFLFLFVFKPSSGDLSYHKILTSYLLISGISYVWIIRVFILVSLVAPFIYLFHKNTKSNNNFYLIILAVFLIYETCRYFLMPYISYGYCRILSYIIFYMIPYSLLFAFGLRISNNSYRENCTLFVCSLLLFFVLFTLLWYKTGYIVPIQAYKYPPSIYYFSYGVAISIFLWITGDRICRILQKNKMINDIIGFVSQNTLWIYLWHIPLVKSLHTNFALQYLVTFVTAICITCFQVSLVNNVIIPKISSDMWKKYTKILFTG